MKWGIRRYQNKDGTRTDAGKKRYADEEKQPPIEMTAKMRTAFENMRNSAPTDEEKDRRVRRWEDARDYDKYEMNYLEAVQNADIFINHKRSEMLTEYATYLTDPMDYMENKSRKLKYA